MSTVVEATKLGFHGGRRRPGQQFQIRPEEFSSNWMRYVDGDKPEVVKEAEKPKQSSGGQRRGQKKAEDSELTE